MSGIQDNYKLTNQTVISYTNSSTGSLINSSLTSVGNVSVSRDHYVNLVRTTPNPNDYLKQISFVLEYSTQWIDLPNIYFLNNLVSSAVIHISCSVLNNSDSSIYKSAVFEIFLKRIGSEWTSTSSFSGDLTGVVFKSSQAYDSINGDYCKIQYKNTNNSDNYTTSVDIKSKTISSFGTFTDSPVSGNYESFYTNLTNKTPNNFLLGDSSGNIVLQDIGITTNENDDVEISSNIVMNNNKTPVDVRGDTTVNRNLITNNKSIKARYVKISKFVFPYTNSILIGEIEVYDENGINIASNGKVYQQSTYSFYDARRAVDGNISTFSHTNGNGYFIIDFEKDIIISKIIIYNNRLASHITRSYNWFLELINDNGEILYNYLIKNTELIYKFENLNRYKVINFNLSNKIYKPENMKLKNNNILSNQIFIPDKHKLNEYPPESTTGVYYTSGNDNSYFYIDTEGISFTLYPWALNKPLYLGDKLVLGGYFIIEMPQSIEIKSIMIRMQHQIKSFYLAGSNDNYNYTNLLFAKQLETGWGLNWNTYINLTKTGNYKFYQFRVSEMSNRSLDVFDFTFHSEAYDFETNSYPASDKIYPPIKFPYTPVNWRSTYTGNVSNEELAYGTGDYKISQSSSWTGGDVTASHASTLFMDDSSRYWGNPYEYTGYVTGVLYPYKHISRGEYVGIFTKNLVVCNVYGGLRFRTQKEKDSIPDMIISSSGNVGLGIEEPGFLLELSKDSAYNTNNSVWDTLSDISVKKNVENADLQICLHNIKNIPLKTWTLKKELADIYSLDLNKTSLGVTAQDTESILPKSIRTTKKKIGNLTYEDFKYLDSDQIFWNLYGAVQNLVSRVENILNKI